MVYLTFILQIDNKEAERYLLIMEKKRRMSFPYRQRAILLIDLAQETWEKIPLGEADGKEMLGGRLLALSLWDTYADYDDLESKSYESGNPVVIASGSAVDTPLLCCDSFTLVTRSPVTHRLSVTSANSMLSKTLLGCGYAALVIKGRSRRLCSLDIDSQQVLFEDAEKYHDMTTNEMEALFKGKSLLSIGPAGEHQVPYASILVDGQNLTRGGVGMVFGLKNLKCISFTLHLSNGRESYDTKALGLCTKTYTHILKTRKIGKSLQAEGSTTLLKKANIYGWAAIDNYSMRIDGRLWGLCPKSQTPEGTSCSTGCSGCFNASPQMPKRQTDLDFTVALALGANLELFDYRSVCQLSQRCVENGLDPLSIGAVLSWARKTRSEGNLPFLPDLQGASAISYLRIIDAMAYKKGTGEQLAMPFDKLVAQYGGSEFAFMVDSLALAPFDLRGLPIQSLLTALGDDTLVFPELLYGNHHHRGNERVLARWGIFLQEMRYLMESLGLCHWVALPFFERPFIHFPHALRPAKAYGILAKLVSVTEGYEVSPKQVASFGKKAWALQQEIDNRLLFRNSRYGLLPPQLLVDASSNFHTFQVVPLARLLDAYWSIRGVK